MFNARRQNSPLVASGNEVATACWRLYQRAYARRSPYQRAYALGFTTSFHGFHDFDAANHGL